MKASELLAPAGSLEKLKAVIAHGADAVYAGVYRHSLRSREYNFGFDSLKEAISYTHSQGRKFYLALNIFCRDSDFDDIKRYLPQVKEAAPDALIVSDPGLALFMREEYPEAGLIVSTQANILNSRSAEEWVKRGAFRITLGRELSLEEIARITASLEAETEVFIHGSLCLAYAGTCLLSRYLTGRDSNRGDCSQPCRFAYSLIEEKGGEQIRLSVDCETSQLLSSCDLTLARELPGLIRSGVASLKIEGRNRVYTMRPQQPRITGA